MRFYFLLFMIYRSNLFVLIDWIYYIQIIVGWSLYVTKDYISISIYIYKWNLRCNQWTDSNLVKLKNGAFQKKIHLDLWSTIFNVRMPVIYPSIITIHQLLFKTLRWSNIYSYVIEWSFCHHELIAHVLSRNFWIIINLHLPIVNLFI